MDEHEFTPWNDDFKAENERHYARLRVGHLLAREARRRGLPVTDAVLDEIFDESPDYWEDPE